ncbi:hypothetical protein N0O92_01315 [Alkalihalobacillus sp. MEB130]|uniref:hypothetical protein n=1 Tax=Alkalihalobacillus sp. MEB130 TaxID=2976704 RepID=UPI0028DD64E4|nr:hypothetical protein [Alkalihalobacillus sp. MEB130]MDT8858849.1 hypothetical protein [Alkalihalobacillus sp. MEB130]
MGDTRDDGGLGCCDDGDPFLEAKETCDHLFSACNSLFQVVRLGALIGCVASCLIMSNHLKLM